VKHLHTKDEVPSKTFTNIDKGFKLFFTKLKEETSLHAALQNHSMIQALTGQMSMKVTDVNI
jgi:hypothetical protein